MHPKNVAMMWKMRGSGWSGVYNFQSSWLSHLNQFALYTSAQIVNKKIGKKGPPLSTTTMPPTFIEPKKLKIKNKIKLQIQTPH